MSADSVFGLLTSLYNIISVRKIGARAKVKSLQDGFKENPI